MDAQITLIKKDFNQYGESFSIEIQDLLGRHYEVKINEVDYNNLKERFNFFTEEMQWPSTERERCY